MVCFNEVPFEARLTVFQYVDGISSTCSDISVMCRLVDITMNALSTYTPDWYTLYFPVECIQEILWRHIQHLDV